jgi:hypothetical protein
MYPSSNAQCYDTVVNSVLFKGFCEGRPPNLFGPPPDFGSQKNLLIFLIFYPLLHFNTILRQYNDGNLLKRGQKHIILSLITTLSITFIFKMFFFSPHATRG